MTHEHKEQMFMYMKDLPRIRTYIPSIRYFVNYIYSKLNSTSGYYHLMKFTDGLLLMNVMSARNRFAWTIYRLDGDVLAMSR